MGVHQENPSSRAQRWSVLDTFRGLAVLLMVQGHTFTVLVRESAFEGAWARLYQMLHGLTAPMFLFGGGLAYGLVSARRRAERASDNHAGLVRRLCDARILRRGLVLIAIGYILQWPYVPITKLLDHPQPYRASFAVGPLQLVGLCLILSEFIFALVRGQARFRIAMLVVSCAIASCAPFVWLQHYSARLIPPFGMWFDGELGSLFPFFPWAAFFFSGVLCSDVVPFARRAPRALAGYLFSGSSALAYALFACWERGERLAWLYGGQHNFWHTNPMYVGFRASLVVAFLAALIAFTPAIDVLRSRFPMGARLFDVLSRQSLAAYVVHLLVLYGTPVTNGLVRLGRVFDLGEGSAIFGGVMLYTLAISVLWDYLKPTELLARLLLRHRRAQIHGIGEREGRDVAAAE